MEADRGREELGEKESMRGRKNGKEGEERGKREGRRRKKREGGERMR